jgi:uncharacterized membrane protein
VAAGAGLVATIGASVTPWYLHIKFVHVAAVMAWSLSTSHAFLFYLVPVVREWRRNPTDPDRVRMRNWAMERFDAGVIIEHVAFPIVLITGLLLLTCGIWSVETGWLVLKLCIVVAIMIPIEIVDYWLSHFGGNKHGLRRRGEHSRYDAMMHVHWLFLLVSTPLVGIFIPLIIFLAIVKPL